MKPPNKEIYISEFVKEFISLYSNEYNIEDIEELTETANFYAENCYDIAIIDEEIEDLDSLEDARMAFRLYELSDVESFGNDVYEEDFEE